MNNKYFRLFALGILAIATFVIVAKQSGTEYVIPALRAMDPEKLERMLPVPGGEGKEEGQALAALEMYWNDRLTYPTGQFDPAWLRDAVEQDRVVPRGIPDGVPGQPGKQGNPKRQN